MSEKTVAAAEARENFAELLDSVETERVVITKHGLPKACLISVREIKAMEETLAVLGNGETINSISAGLADLCAGNVDDVKAASRGPRGAGATEKEQQSC